MRLYTVSLCDDLLEYPMLDGRVYLTEHDAQRRADRMTYEDDLCRSWATVEPVECMWDTDAKGPFDDYKSDWMRFIDYATGIKRDRDRARAENARLRSCLSDSAENAKQIMGEYGELESENARLRKELEMERENNASIRRLFDAVAPRCGKPDCPSLVEYVEKLRELVAKMARALGVDSEWCHRECKCEFGCDGESCPLDQALLEFGIEVEVDA